MSHHSMSENRRTAALAISGAAILLVVSGAVLGVLGPRATSPVAGDVEPRAVAAAALSEHRELRFDSSGTLYAVGAAPVQDNRSPMTGGLPSYARSAVFLTRHSNPPGYQPMIGGLPEYARTASCTVDDVLSPINGARETEALIAAAATGASVC